MTTETITWISDGPPDADETVLLFMPGADVEVWPGYWNGDDTFYLADGMPLPRAAVRAWAAMPSGHA